MNIALTLKPDAQPDALVKIVKLAEDLGFSHCYVSDEGFSRDVYVTLTALAQATSRIHLGPGITNPYTRHPVATAVAIASLDELSGGRAFLGLGAGGSLVFGPLQLARPSPLSACREAAQIFRLLTTGESVNYQGQHFQLAEARLGFRARPDIELHWAARGPKMLALGSEIADVVMLHGIPRFELANVLSLVHESAATAGRKVRVQYAVPLAYDSASLEGVRVRTAFHLVDSTDDVRATMGVSPELHRELRRLVTMEGPQAAAHLVSDEILDHYVVQGDVDRCAADLQQLVEAHGIGGLTIELNDLTQADLLLTHAAKIVALM